MNRVVFGNRICGALCLLWMGMIQGVGFSALLKFEAPSLSRPSALDVGRHVFGAFSWVELGWALVVTVLVAVGGPAWKKAPALGGLWLILLVDRFWLLPALSSRAEQVLAGQTLEASGLHPLYVGLEGVKWILLAAIAFLCFREPGRQPMAG